MVYAELERKALHLFENAAVVELEVPLRRMKHFEKRVLRPAGVSLDGLVQHRVTKPLYKIKSCLKKHCDLLRKQLPRAPGRTGHTVRLTRESIDQLLTYTREAVATALPELQRYHRDANPDLADDEAALEEDFWQAMAVPRGALNDFAEKLIMDCSSHDLLTPLEVHDTRVKLEVHHVSARSFIRNLAKDNVQVDDLDRATIKIADVHKPPPIPPLTVSDLLWDCSPPDGCESSPDLHSLATALGGYATCNEVQQADPLSLRSYFTLGADGWEALFDSTSDEIWPILQRSKAAGYKASNANHQSSTSPLAGPVQAP